MIVTHGLLPLVSRWVFLSFCEMCVSPRWLKPSAPYLSLKINVRASVRRTILLNFLVQDPNFSTENQISKHCSFWKICQANFAKSVMLPNMLPKYANCAKFRKATKRQKGTISFGSSIVVLQPNVSRCVKVPNPHLAYESITSPDLYAPFQRLNFKFTYFDCEAVLQYSTC